MAEETKTNVTEPAAPQEVVSKDTASAGSEAKKGTSESAVAADTGESAVKVKAKRGKKRIDVNGHCIIKATFNNTIVTITDVSGNVISWGSSGKLSIKGSRKSTPFAAQLSSDSAAKAAMDMGLRKVEVRVKGAGAGRESAVRALKAAGLEIISIRDITGIPHNGCRPKKKRRV